MVFAFSTNHYFCREINFLNHTDDEDIARYEKRLQDMGAVNVLVSRASKGAMLIDEYGNSHSIGVAPGELVNSVGCGDSMVAGFLAGYIEKNDYSYALKLGSACGNATAFSPELATKDEIIAVLKNGFNE